MHPHKTVYAQGCVGLGDRPDFNISFFFINEGRHLLPLEIGNKGSQVCVKRGRGFSFVCVPMSDVLLSKLWSA